MPELSIPLDWAENSKTVERFYRKVRLAPTGCLVWAGALSHGYGRFKMGGATYLAHRLAWVEHHHQPIPDGLTLDHLCRVPSCVNADHLEPVTRGTNVLRGDGLTAVNSRKTHCPRGHSLTDDNLIPANLRQGGRACRACREGR